jgi:shikimate dehydrogenase
MTMQLGIIGYPLHHTLSPRLHGFLLNKLGLPGTYQAWETRPDELPDTLDWLEAQGVRGINVTIPHKVAVMSFLTEIDPMAQQMQAVNTITFEPGGRRRLGQNTDSTGFWRSLPVEVKQSLPNRPVLVLGAGGSSRAVLAALIQHGAPSITLAVRNPEKATDTLAVGETLCEQMSARTVLAVQPWAFGDAATSLERYALVVNTTPIGMASGTQAGQSPLSGAALETLPPSAWVVDLIYRPLMTPLMALCESLSIPSVNGLGMLVHQGVAALEIWTGQQVPESLSAELFQSLQAELLR